MEWYFQPSVIVHMHGGWVRKAGEALRAYHSRMRQEEAKADRYASPRLSGLSRLGQSLRCIIVLVIRQPRRETCHGTVPEK